MSNIILYLSTTRHICWLSHLPHAVLIDDETPLCARFWALHAGPYLLLTRHICVIAKVFIV